MFFTPHITCQKSKRLLLYDKGSAKDSLNITLVQHQELNLNLFRKTVKY